MQNSDAPTIFPICSDPGWHDRHAQLHFTQLRQFI